MLRARIKVVLPAVLVVGAVVPLLPGAVQAGTPATTVAEPAVEPVVESVTTVGPVVESVTTVEPVTTVGSPTSIGGDGVLGGDSVPPTSVVESSVSSVAESVPVPEVVSSASLVDAASASSLVEQPAAEQTGSISGRVWKDRNGDGVIQEREKEYGWLSILVKVYCDVEGSNDPYSNETYYGRVETDRYAGGAYRIEGLPLSTCTVYVDRYFSDDQYEMDMTYDPDGKLDDRTEVTLTADAPDVTVNFGYTSKYSFGFRKWVGDVEDTVKDGRISAGDTITYYFVYVHTGPVYFNGLTDEKLGLVDWGDECVDESFNDYWGYCVLEASYIITEQDVAAGGVENSATATFYHMGLDEYFTDVSDTRTDPQGNLIDPRQETDNPLKMFPNDPNDPNDDPTTFLFTKPTTPGGETTPRPAAPKPLTR